MPRQIVTGFSCSNAIILQLVQEISRLAEESIQEKGVFVLGFSGGPFIYSLFRRLVQKTGSMDFWAKTIFVQADEFFTSYRTDFNIHKNMQSVFFCQMSSVGQDHIVRFSCCQGDTPEEAAGLFDAEIRDNAKRHGYLSKNGIPQIDMLLLATDKNGFVCSSKASNYVEFTRNLMVRMETPNAFGRFNTARLPHFSLNRTIIDQAKNLFFIFPENFTS